MHKYRGKPMRSVIADGRRVGEGTGREEGGGLNEGASSRIRLVEGAQARPKALMVAGIGTFESVRIFRGFFHSRLENEPGNDVQVAPSRESLMLAPDV